MKSPKAGDWLSALADLRFRLVLAVFLAMIYGCERKKAHLRTSENPSGIGRTIDNMALPDGATGVITGALASVSGVAAGPYTIHVEGFRAASTMASLGETFTLPAVPVGERRLIVTDASVQGSLNLTATRFGARTASIAVSEGVSSDAGGISVSAAGTVRGRVIGASSVGTSAFIPGTWFIAKVDENGHYTLEGVPNGSYYIDVQRPDYVKGYSNQVEMAAGADLTVPPITIDTLLTPAGAIALDSGAAFASGRTVRVDISQEPAANQIMLSEDPSFAGAKYQKVAETVETTFGADGPATLYAKFLKNDTWETEAVSDTIVVDSAELTGTIGLSDGTSYTNTRNIQLAIASADLSGISEMILSEKEDFADAAWVSFATPMPFTLSADNGEKTLYLKLRNKVGHESALISTQIGYDTLPPDSPTIVAGTDGYTNTLAVPLTLGASSAVAPVSQVKLSESSDLAGASWQAYAASMTYSVAAGDGVKTIYAKFRDAAGNESSIVNASVILDTVAPTLPVLQNTSGRIAAATGSVQIVFTTASTDATALKGYEVRGGQYATWTEVSTPIIFTLANANAWYALEVRGKDRAGNTSGTAALRIFHGDVTILAGSAAQLDGATSRTSASAALTLTAAYTPYFLTGSGTSKSFTDYKLTVEAGSTLKVDSGMTINFTDFTVSGTSASPVTITSAASAPAKNDWRTLSLDGSVALSHLNVAYNSYTMLNETVSAPQIINSKFSNFASTGINDMSTGSGTFTNIDIDCPNGLTGYYGSLASGAAKTFSKVIVHNCSQGISMDGTLNVTITNSNFTNNSFANIYVDTASTGSVTLTNDYFGYNSAGGTLDNLQVQNADSPAIITLTGGTYSTATISGTGPQ